MADVVIGSLTDEKILEYTADRVIMTDVDFNLKEAKASDTEEGFDLVPMPKGIYDSKYFGSIYSKSCNCGRVKKVGVMCEVCNSMLMTDIMAFSRYARIDMGFYYATNLKYKSLVKYLKNTYSFILDYEPDYPMFDFILNVGSDEAPKYKYIVDPSLLIAKFSWDNEEKAIRVTNKIDDPRTSGLDSLVVTLQDAGDENWKKYLNKYLIVTPARMRPVSHRREGNRKKLIIPDSSSYYSALYWLSDNISWEFSKYYAQGDNKTKEEAWRLALKKAAACKVINAAEDKLSSIFKTSKQNIARQSYKIRQPNSGRSVITGDPNLRIDEVGIPIHLAYEAMKSDFVEHIKNELRLKRSEAVERYTHPDDLIMGMFKEYAENRKVLLNRAPSLHKYNILSMNVRLTEDSSIHLPILSIKPFNADFDGDTMSFFLIPTEIEDYAEELMSPRNIKKFEKDDSFMFTPSHEVLNGLSLVTRLEKPKEMKTITDLVIAKELIDNNKMDVYTMFKYKGRETTWGREKVSEIIMSSLDHIIGPTKITGKNIKEIYAVINKYDNETRTKMIKGLQDFALEWVFEYGVTTPTLKEMAGSVDHEFKKQVDGILRNDKIDPKEKFVKAKTLYDSRQEYVKKHTPQEFIEKLEESDRGKLFQIFEMSVPQFMVNDQGEVVVPERPLVEGLNEREYVTHAFNNRRLLAVKSLGVPAGGYLTRQLVFNCQSFSINTTSDPENPGILLPRYRCEGRTTIDGERVGRALKKDPNDKVRVRSIVVSKRGIVSEDMFSDKYGFTMDNPRVGISFASSFTEAVTQKLLGLKHGGASKQIPKDYIIKAPEDCTVIAQDENTYTIQLSGSKERKVYPLSPMMRFVEGTGTDKKFYSKGKDMVELVLPLPPTLTVEQLVFLIGGASILKNNPMTKVDVIQAESYTLKGGIIHYDFAAKTVTIGDKSYEYDENTAYYYAEGENLPPITKFRAGLTTPSMILPENPTPSDIEEVYMTYRDQVYKITENENLNEELIELVFRSFIIDGKYYKLQQSQKLNSSILTAISYGYASKSIMELISEPQVITNDPMSNVLLNYMMKEAAHQS